MASTGDGPYEMQATLQLLDDSRATIDTVTFPQPSPMPTPVPEPTPAPEPVPGSASSTSPTSVPTLVSPPATSGAMIACPEMQSPAMASAG
jgi:outer membrane biosynthesis protein TonB